MPTLRKYKPSSPKSGYYIQANVGGSHPITLQVTGIARTILRQTGYQPDGSVPTKLVWAMYDLDLVYTESSIDTSSIQNVSVGKVFRDLNLGNKLSAGEKAKLVSYIEKYEGPKKGTLTKLKKQLEKGVDRSTSKSAKGGLEKAKIPQTKAEAVSYLFTLTYNLDEFRKAKKRVDQQFLLRSLQTFLPHSSVDPSSVEIGRDGSIRYQLVPPEYKRKIWLKDYRGPCTSSINKDAEYVIELSEKEEETQAVIVDNEVIQFTASKESEYDAHQLEEDLEWILPLIPIEIGCLTEENIKRCNLSKEDAERYRGVELEPLQPVNGHHKNRMFIVEVDRISNSGNPVIEPNDHPAILDQGEPGEKYLAKNTTVHSWQAISKVVE